MSTTAENQDSSANVLPGFEHVMRSWDATLNLYSSKILPGEYFVTDQDEMITTVLGSCVSACVRDPVTGVGGMNHFMLPGDKTRNLSQWAGQDSLATRYGIAAMESLINDILKRGSRKDRLEVKLFGGGKVLSMEVIDVGGRNIKFVKEFLKAEGLKSIAEDLGDTYPRKVAYFPKTGKVMLRRLRSMQNRAVAEQERKYETLLAEKEIPGEIELFD